MNTLIDRLTLIHQENPSLAGHLGQSGFVTVSGATISVVNQWMSGRIKSMGIRYALNIEQNLGYSHTWLMTGDGQPRAGNAVPPRLEVSNIRDQLRAAEQEVLAGAIEVLALYRTASKTGKKYILNAARASDQRPAPSIAASDDR